MKKYNLLLLALFFAFFSVNGQILSSKRAKKSAENKTQQRVDNKVDQGIDKGLDGVENFLFGKKKKKKKEEIKEDSDEAAKEMSGSLDASAYDDAYNNKSESSSDSDQEPDMSGLFGSMGGAVEVAESFEFNSSIDILLTTTDKKGNATVMNMTMMFPDNDEYFGMEMGSPENEKEQMPPMKMIYDFKNQQMITMMNNSGQKIGMVMKIDEEQLEKWTDDDESDNIDEMPEWKKTGKTKTILGYSCDQYVFSSEDGDGEAWVSDDDDLHIGYAMNAMANSQNKNKKNNSDYPDGAILEMTFNGNDGEKMTWIATDIKTDTDISLKTEGYQFMSLGGK